MAKHSQAACRALLAVANGKVRHVPPSTWIGDVERLRATTLQALLNTKLVRVTRLAKPGQEARRVVLTPRGVKVLQRYEDFLFEITPPAWEECDSHFFDLDATCEVCRVARAGYRKRARVEEAVRRGVPRMNAARDAERKQVMMLLEAMYRAPSRPGAGKE